MTARTAWLLGSVRSSFQHTVVDLGSRLTESVLEIMGVADRTFVVLEPTVPCVRAAGRLAHTLSEVPRLGPRLSLVLNKCGAKGMLKPAEVEQALGYTAERAFRDSPEEVLESMNRGKPLVSAFPGSALAGEFTGFARALVPAAEPVAKKGLFGRMFSVFGG
jgi:Flp pilus assembly CpaE family ATPase